MNAPTSIARTGAPLARRGFLVALGAGLLGAGCGAAEEPAALLPAEEPRADAAAPPAALALVLSGGGLRGFAHLGVLQALRELGVTPNLIVGTSIGAIIGGLVASGCSAAALADAALAAELDPWGSWLVTPAARSARLESLLRAQLECRLLEDFPQRFAAVATDRASGCLVALTAGDAARAILASAALPGALAPVRVAGAELVDGCLGTPLPVRLARALGARRVIAVDVSFHPEVPAPSGLIASVLHAGMLMTRHLAAADRAAADVVLDPVLPPVPEITLERRAQLVATGARAVADAAPQLIALASAPAPSGAGPEGQRPALTCGAPV